MDLECTAFSCPVSAGMRVQSTPVVLMDEDLFLIFSPTYSAQHASETHWVTNHPFCTAVDCCVWWGKASAANVQSRYNPETTYIITLPLFVMTSIVALQIGNIWVNLGCRFRSWKADFSGSCMVLELKLEGLLFPIAQALVTCMIGGCRCSKLSPLINFKSSKLLVGKD